MECPFWFGTEKAWGVSSTPFYSTSEGRRPGDERQHSDRSRPRTGRARSPLDLGLDVYDVERRGGTLRVTLDTPAGADAGITLDTLALATRLVSRELDHVDPVPGRYTLEVTSPGVERSLRVPEHFRREVGKTIAVRLHAVSDDERRLEGDLVAADDTGITVRVDDGERGRPVRADRPSTHGVRVGSQAQAWWPQPTERRHREVRLEEPQAQGEEAVVSNLDMSEAIHLLAQEKGLSEDALLHVLVDALASAYKRRDGAADEVVVEVNPETMEFTFTAYDLDEDGNWVNERDDTPRREELGRIAAQTFRQVMSQRIREVERDRKFEEYANREGDIVTGIIQRTDSRYTLLDLGRVEALLAPGRAGPLRASPAGRPGQGLHRRGAQDRQGTRRSWSAARIPV